MTRPILILTALGVLASLAAGADDVQRKDTARVGESADQDKRIGQWQPLRDNSNVPEQFALSPSPSAAATYGANRLVVSSGGGRSLPATNTGMALTINQNAAGESFGQNYGMQLGFWYAVSACPISVTGDVQQSGDVNLTDVVYLVNYVLKAGPEPYPCPGAGDANCSGGVNSTDIIYLVNYVLKAGPPPCDACSLVPWTWSCP